MARTTPNAERSADPAALCQARAGRRAGQASQPREADPFDLPPPTGGAAPALPAGDRTRARRRTTPEPVDSAMSQARPQGGLPGRRARHAPAAGDQDHPQGNADDRRPAADPICGRRGARGGDRADDLRHRPRQVGAGRLFRHRLRARSDDARARARASTRSRRRDARLRRDRLGPPAAAARASAMRSGARATSSATSRSRCCCPTI